MYRICLICSKEFSVKPSQVKLGWGKYCSKDCQYKGQIKGVIVKCYICSKQFRKPLAKMKHSMSGKFFCSKRCQAIWRNKFFSGDKSVNWKGGIQVYREILIRSEKEKVCILCGIRNLEILSAHHIDHNRKNNHLSNLTWLCMNCHHLVHHHNDLDSKIKKGIIH